MINYLELLHKFNRELPHFPDGRIDYTNAKEALTVLVFVIFENELFLGKRSEKVRAHQGKWDVIAGYFDEMVTPEQKALIELKEETGIEEKYVMGIHAEELFSNPDPEDPSRVWYDIPVFITLQKKPEVKLDFEHTEHAWVPFEEIENYDIVSLFRKNLEQIKAKLYDYSKKHFPKKS